MSTYCDHFEPLFSDADDHFIGMTEGGGTVTAEKIIQALGYTPASEADLAPIEAAVGALEENKADKTVLEAKADKTALDETNRSLDFLWKLNQGVTWDIEQREESGHAQLPKGGVYGNVDEVRGKTEQETTNGYNLSPNKTAKATSTGNVNLSTSGTFGSVKEGKSYVLSFLNLTKSRAYTQIRIYSQGDQVTQVSANLVPDGTMHWNFTASVDGDVCLNGVVGTEYGGMVVFDDIQLEEGSTAHPYEKFSGGIPMPNPDYPSEIVSVDSIEILHTDADGNTLSERTIIPPRPLNAIGGYKDKMNVVSGEWEYGCIDVDLGTLGWSGTPTSRYESNEPLPNAKLTVSGNDMPNAMCTRYKVVNYKDEEAGKGLTIIWQTSYAAGHVWVKDAAANPTEFTNAVRGAHLIYAADNLVTEPINPTDLDYLRNLTLNKGENLFITDNHGRDVSYLMSDFINLKEALA